MDGHGGVPVTLFYCYVDEDELWHQALDRHLGELKRLQLIECWDQGKILPGERISKEREESFSRAQIILFLISPYFLASNAANAELERALQLYEAGKVHLVPLLVRPVDLKPTPFASLQILPRNKKAISMWTDRDEAFASVAEEIYRLVKRIKTTRSPLQGTSSVARKGMLLPLWICFCCALIIPTSILWFFMSINKNSFWFFPFAIIYIVLVFFASMLTNIWQDTGFEARASLFDQQVRNLFSWYHRYYCRYFTYEHRYLDMKGMTTQSFSTLELEQVFVDLHLDTRAPHAVSPSPIRLPIQLRTGSHNIWEYLKAKPLRDEHFVVLGPPGSGKTTLLKHLGLALLNQKRLRTLPVLLYLREHSQQIRGQAEYSLAKAIRFHTDKWSLPMPIGWIEHRLARGQCLLLLDGLDEVADPQSRQQMVAWVKQQIDIYGNNRFLLTSRPFGYTSNPLQQQVAILEVEPFTFKQTTDFILNWYRITEIKSAMRDDPGVRMDAERGAHDLLRRLRETTALYELAVNPLLLTMIATIHRYRGTLPGARVELYKEICEVFLEKRQAARGLIQDLRAEQLQFVLQPLAYQMMLEGWRDIESVRAEQAISAALREVSLTLSPKEFLLEIERRSGLLIEREAGLYCFAHLTFQEYLAAIYIREHGLIQMLTTHLDSSWWHETTRLYCAQADATPIILACLQAAKPSVTALALALECQYEARSVQAEVQLHLQMVVYQGIEDDDPERKHIASDALLTRRLRQLQVLTDHVAIDTFPIRQAEYQLFLNERRVQGQHFEPDHWRSFWFAPGAGLKGVLGVRRSDAIAFCEWLTLREKGAWKYRLPLLEELQLLSKEHQKAWSSLEGYWLEGEPQFSWSQGQPSDALLTKMSDMVLQAATRDFERAHELLLNLARTFARSNNYTLDVVRDLGRACNLAFNIASILKLALVHDLSDQLDQAYKLVQTRDFVLASSLDFFHYLSLSRTLVRYLHRGDLDAICTHAMELYVILLFLWARQTGMFPASEGVFLVRELPSHE